MGVYLNPGAGKFRISLQSRIYVDKSGLIAYTNSVIDTEQRFLCVSRPRRFGKSMTLGMLSSYYGCEENTESQFAGLRIATDPSFRKYLNQYEVIHIDMQEFLSDNESIDGMIESLKKSLLWELTQKFNGIVYYDKTNLVRSMRDIYTETEETFIILIDEWDCIFREYPDDKYGHKKYLDFLRAWLKDKAYVSLAYMTGILPIKKYGSHSALNMFTELSMVDPGVLAEYVGFTEAEVKSLCTEYHMDFSEMKAWYDGYTFEGIGSIYNPKSVVESILNKKYKTYWNRTETYEALKDYISINFDGLKDSVIAMLAGNSITVNTEKFANDMNTFTGADDVLTLLIHLGYLSYQDDTKLASIPNREVSAEYLNAIESPQWNEVLNAMAAAK